MGIVDGVTLSIAPSEESLPIALATSSISRCQAGQSLLPRPHLSVFPRQPTGQHSGKAWRTSLIIGGNNISSSKSFSIGDKDECDKFLPLIEGGPAHSDYRAMCIMFLGETVGYP